MKLTVGTVTPVLIPVPEGSDSVLIQNLGTGNVYVDGNPAVTTATGVKIAAAANLVVSSPNNVGELFLISDAASTDVRYIA
jgi:hypothetical protein